MIYRLIAAEMLKLRRTPVRWITVSAPVLVLVADYLAVESLPVIRSERGAANILWSNVVSNGWYVWTLVAMPLMIALQAIVMARVEHKGRLWKQLLTFPVSRAWSFGMKPLFCGVFVALSQFIFCIGLVVVGLLVGESFGVDMEKCVPWARILITGTAVFLASWLTIGIQTWVSLRFSGVAAPLCTAFAALLVGLLLVKHTGASLFPWTLPAVCAVFQGRSSLRVPLLLGCVGGFLVCLICSLHLAQREVVE